MRIQITPGGQVMCHATLQISMPPSVVWGELRDFCRFASHDLFHDEIQIDGHIPRRGAAITMVHRFVCIRIPRVGKILRWREWRDAEGRAGFAYSDCSRLGPKRGFPHVFGCDLSADEATGCRLKISVRGRWTARLIPPWAARMWLAWVFAFVVMRVRNDLLLAIISRQERALA